MKIITFTCTTCLVFWMPFLLAQTPVSDLMEGAGLPVNYANAVIDFPDASYDWGYISLEEGLEGRLEFQNPGNVPLRIIDVESSCREVEIQYPSDPIAPGQGGNIQLRWKPQRQGAVRCFLTVKSTTRQMVNVISVSGVGY